MKNFIAILLFFLSGSILAQQAEIAVSTKITNKFGPAEGVFGDMLVKQIAASRDEIITRLGENPNVRFVKEYNPSTTNFILRIRLHIKFQQKNIGDWETLENDTTGIYYIRVIFQLDDPNRNVIITMNPMHQIKFFSNRNLSEEELLDRYWPFFLKVAVPRANADVLGEIIKSKITYSNTSPDGAIINDQTITYKAEDDKKPKADGKQIGDIIVKMGKLYGEAHEYSITKYKLKCEKGKFLETNSKEIEFTGADYCYEEQGGKLTFKAKYKSYNCDDYEEANEKFQDIFTLIEIQRLSDNSEIELKEQKIKFSCEKLYDIFAIYHAPGFAHVELVWEKATIRFLDEGDKMQFFDRTAYIQSGGNGQNPTGTDGKPLDIPFAMDIPGIGKITNYGAPQNNIPKVISIYSLGAYEGHARFKIMKTEEALNMCELKQIGDGPVYLDLSFDLFAGGPNANTDWIQHTVHCIEDNIISDSDKTSIIYKSPYPTAFGQVTISEADIIYFKGFDEVEKTLSNGRATLKIEFKLSEETAQQ